MNSENEPFFSYINMDSRVPKDHPLRPIRKFVTRILKKMNRQFDKLYSHTGRPSIPPEQLLKAMLVQMLFSVRSERQLMEQLNFNLLFRWFVGLAIDTPVWDPTVFTKNRDRLLDGDIASKFFGEVLNLADNEGLTSSDHFTVDGTLIEAWASQKSFTRKTGDIESVNNKNGRNGPSNFHNEKRKNATHQSKTDPDARLFRKGRGKEAKLCYMGHLFTENRNGLVVNAHVSQANGRAERETAKSMARQIRGNHRVTLGGDKNYDTAEFTSSLREFNVVPHVAQKTHCRSGIDGRTTRHAGYQVSQRKRKCIEEVFGWLKTIAGFGKVKLRGRDRVGWLFKFAAAAYNLVRIRNILQPA